MAKGKKKAASKAKKSAKKSVKKTAKKAIKKIVKAKIKAKVKTQPKSVAKKAAPVKFKVVAKKDVKNWDDVLSPIDDRLLVEEVFSGERVTAGGLIIPDTVAMTGYKTAKVLAVGPGRRDKSGKRHPLGVEKNETVIFEEYSGIEIKIFERDLKLVKESEILGIKTK